MFQAHAIERAVDLQRRSYHLLKWLASAVDRGFISTYDSHEYATLPEAARAWIDRHYADLPPAARPPVEDLDAFCNLFTTYLESSFDLVDDPGEIMYSPNAHCFCPICSCLVAAPRLRTKKLTRYDKQRARDLQARAIRQLALERDRTIEDAEPLLADRAVSEAAGLVAYAHDLGRRIDGVVEGPTSLALWRTFAWLPAGSPKLGFDLSAKVILDAEALLCNLVDAHRG